MRFDVVRTARDDSSVPEHLSLVQPLDRSQAVRTRTFEFGGNPTLGVLPGVLWGINGEPFEPARVDANPRLDDIEIWRFVNRAFVGRSMLHPVHTHLAPFQVLSRNGGAPLRQERGWKDTVAIEDDEEVEVIIRWSGHKGRYLLHCHNVEHEDHSMMARVDVVTPRIILFIVGGYLWLMWILLGSIVLETFMVYPNVFHDPPKSLTTALEFMTIRAPSDFYPPLGFSTWVFGAASLIAAWRVRSARYWIALSVAMILSEGLVSMAFFWPRNTILFIEGSAVHSAAVLRQTAEEFQRMHWWRVVFNAIGSVAVFTGFLRLYRHTLTMRTG